MCKGMCKEQCSNVQGPDQYGPPTVMKSCESTHRPLVYEQNPEPGLKAEQFSCVLDSGDSTKMPSCPTDSMLWEEGVRSS
jgi:hypothetical protein